MLPKYDPEPKTKQILESSIKLINETLGSERDNYAKSNPVLLSAVIQAQVSLITNK